MSKRPAITGDQALRAFERAGFEEDRVKGSHHILKKSGVRYHLSIPVHAGKNIGKGLLKKLIEASGLTEEQFYEHVS